MNDILEYKGYHTKIEYSVSDHVLHGKIEGIRDLVNFESDSVDNIEQEFHSAVDDYLAICADLGVEPNKEYSGAFNVRCKPETHERLSLAAFSKGVSLNTIVNEAFNYYLQHQKLKTHTEWITMNYIHKKQLAISRLLSFSSSDTSA